MARIRRPSLMLAVCFWSFSSLSCTAGFRSADESGSSAGSHPLTVNLPLPLAKTYGQLQVEGRCETGADLKILENGLPRGGAHSCIDGSYSIPVSLNSAPGEIRLAVQQNSTDGAVVSRKVDVRKIERCSLSGAALDPVPIATLNANTMPIKTWDDSGLGNPQGDGSFLFGFNSVNSETVTFPSAGFYVFRVHAKHYNGFDTPSAHPYPKLQISVDGRVIAEADVGATSLSAYASNDPLYEVEAFPLTAGPHLVTIGAGNWSKEVGLSHYQVLFVGDVEILSATASCADTADGVDLSTTDFARLADKRNLRLGTVLDTGISIGGLNLNVFRDDPLYPDVLRRFNHVQPGSVFLMDRVATAEGSFDFTAADEVVDFAVRNGLSITLGHLVWHHFIPSWLVTKNDPAFTRQFLEVYIKTVVNRYRGKIRNYIVVNEALDDAEGTRDSFWRQQYSALLGPAGRDQYIQDAFQWAREADPDAILIYNDYDIDELGRKSDAAYELVTSLRSDGTPVDAIGLQGHLDTDTPQFHRSTVENMTRFANLGLKIHVTEYDVGFFSSGAPTPLDLKIQAQYYRNGLKACLSVSACELFTTFGTADKYWWGPQLSPPLHFGAVMNDDYSRKPAYDQLLRTLYGLDPWR